MTNTKQITRTQAKLGQIPELAATLPMLLIPSQSGANDGPRPAPTSRPPTNVGLLDLIQGRDLDLWVQLTIDELPEDQPVPDDVPSSRDRSITAMCAWLSGRAAWIIDLHSDFPASVGTIYGEYRRAAGDPEEPDYHCPNCEWIVEPKDDGAWWGCTGCSRTWTLGAEISRLMERQAAVMTLGEISQRLGIPHATLRRWAGKRFSSVGTRSGRPLYDLRVVELASQRIRDTA